MKTLLVFIFAVTVAAQTQPKCKQSEYLSMDGRCLHNRAGEQVPAGDGCNTVTCTNPSCRGAVVTAMACSHGDDPAIVPPISSGQLAYSTRIGSFALGNIFVFVDGPKMIEVKDKDGAVMLTAYRDGHVEAKDPAKVDDAARQFWMLMAKYMPQFCRQEAK